MERPQDLAKGRNLESLSMECWGQEPEAAKLRRKWLWNRAEVVLPWGFHEKGSQQLSKGLCCWSCPNLYPRPRASLSCCGLCPSSWEHGALVCWVFATHTDVLKSQNWRNVSDSEPPETEYVIKCVELNAFNLYIIHSWQLWKGLFIFLSAKMWSKIKFC